MSSSSPTARVLDGIAIANDIKAEVALEVATARNAGYTPGLAVVLVGEVPASQIYVRSKVKTCAELGIYSEMITPPESVTTAELLALTHENSFAAVGLSVGCEIRLDGMSETIRAIRKSSRNRSVGVLLGGPMLVLKPELAARMGADATGRDGRDAVRQAERIRSESWRRQLGI